MRSATIGLVGAALILGGCDDTGSGPPPPDMAPAPDLSAGPKDMTALPDQTVLPDLTALPDLAPPPVSGTAVLTDISAVAPLPIGPDGGIVNTPVRVIAPLVGFGPAGAPHDFSNMGMLGGCQGDHYDVSKNKVPAQDIDAGLITFTGYQGGVLLSTGMAAPAQITCGKVKGFYTCSYGMPVNGGPDPKMNTNQSPYMMNSMPIAKDSTISMSGAGGSMFGPFSGKVTARDAPSLTNTDLTTIKYDPTADFVFNFTCPTEANSACGFTVIGVSISASDQTPQNYGQGPMNSSGNVTCFGLAGGGKLTINQPAIAAAFGCDKAGANCDVNLKSTRTVVVRLDLPTSLMTTDAAMSKVTAAAGRGLSGIAAR